MILSITLLALAGLFDACRDKVQFHFGKSVFKGINDQFFDPAISWRNKYKNGDPSRGEAFPLAKGALVFLSDGWHLFKYLFNASLIVGAYLLPHTWYWPVIGWLVYSTVFSVCFTYLLERKSA
jgi:hypothetical protein